MLSASILRLPSPPASRVAPLIISMSSYSFRPDRVSVVPSKVRSWAVTSEKDEKMIKIVSIFFFLIFFHRNN